MGVSFRIVAILFCACQALASVAQEQRVLNGRKYAVHVVEAGQTRFGIARALTVADGERRSPLKRAGLLTRDARKKERKKYGQPGARKRFQYSKR